MCFYLPTTSNYQFYILFKYYELSYQSSIGNLYSYIFILLLNIVDIILTELILYYISFKKLC